MSRIPKIRCIICDKVTPSVRVVDAYEAQTKNDDFNTAWNHTVYCIPDGLKP